MKKLIALFVMATFLGFSTLTFAMPQEKPEVKTAKKTEQVTKKVKKVKKDCSEECKDKAKSKCCSETKKTDCEKKTEEKK